MENNVIFEERTYPSADGKTQVHAYIWRPTEPPRGIIQLSHGMCEYVQRYDEWARRFCAAGYIFCGNDHLGHGNTAPNADELGYTDPRNGATYLVEDLHTLTLLMKKEYPAAPVVLYGHSMGSFAARLYLSRYGKDIAAAIISGTAGAGAPTGLGRMLAHTVAAFKGDHHRSKLLTAVAFGSYNNKFKDEDSRQSWLTRDLQVQEAYAKDAFSKFIFTTAGYDTLFSLLGEVSKRSWAKKVPKTLPVMLLSGDMDPVGAYGKGVRQVQERLTRAGCERVVLKLYEGGRHEMHNETNRDEVFADILTFLEDALQ
jgi:alpha-beta hydrolase superfamily lysophospholipase